MPTDTCSQCGKQAEFTFEHDPYCPISLKAREPKRFRVKVEKHPASSNSPYQYGCYFPLTDLVVGDMGGRGTGKPKDVEWLDE